VKRISTTAYQALRNALPVVFWYKNAFASFLKTALRNYPELISPLDFSLTKREVTDSLVNLLIRREDQYKDLTIQLMIDVAEMTEFPDINSLPDKDRDKRLRSAQEATATLREIVRPYMTSMVESKEAIQKSQAESARLQQFTQALETLLTQFLELQRSNDPQSRGLIFEKLLNDLFEIFDMEPRLAYTVEADQIDGSISFETDDYIVEARWRATSASRADGDIFKQKVLRRGKNALGLFVSVEGFASTFIEEFSKSTPFITMDGGDLLAVFERRIRLDDLIRLKKRHMNDTGSCHLPVSQALSGPDT
jgi:hypothetical protein